MTTINTARPVTPPVAAWRDQLPTLIRVYGIVLTLVLLVAFVFIFMNFVVDLFYALLDPRIRFQ